MREIAPVRLTKQGPSSIYHLDCILKVGIREGAHFLVISVHFNVLIPRLQSGGSEPKPHAFEGEHFPLVEIEGQGQVQLIWDCQL